MGKVIAVIVVILIVIVSGGVIYTSMNHTNSTSTNPTNSAGRSTMDMKSTNASNSTPAQSTNSVAIANFAFSPAAITIKKGTTVTWTNNDATPHTVTEVDNQKGPDSSNLEPGKTYSFTFNATGTFEYHCSIHPNMTGTVVVTD